MTVHFALTKLGLDAARFDIRLLNGGKDDTAAYRALREKIRNGDGARNFADSYTREDELNEPLWREWCAAKREHCIVAAFDRKEDNKLASIMMITAQGPANSLVAELEATWVELEYRGSGVAKRCYEEVQKTAMEIGYQHAVVFIREDNHHSRKIREAQGFTHVRTKKDEHWADGSIADTNLFILDLYPDCPASENPHERAIHRLEETIKSMNGEVPFIGEAMRDRIKALKNETYVHATRYLAGTLASLGDDATPVARGAVLPVAKSTIRVAAREHGLT